MIRKYINNTTINKDIHILINLNHVCKISHYSNVINFHIAHNNTETVYFKDNKKALEEFLDIEKILNLVK